MQDVMVSVIVPVYKVERYLKKCIQSIVDQTYKNLDIILVDDGSPDNCGKICDDYAALDTRITVLHQENSGLSSARNAGISIAKGEYLSFIDSDDYVALDFIEKLVSVCIQKEAEICVCGFSSDESRIGSGDTSVCLFDKHESIMNLCNDGTGLYTVAWNKLYVRHLFDELRFPHGRIHEDEAVMYKLLWNSDKTAVIGDKLYFYRYNEQSITNSFFSERRMDAALGYKERIDFLTSHSEEKAAVLTHSVYCYFLRSNWKNIRQSIENWRYWKKEMYTSYDTVVRSPYVKFVKKLSLSIHMLSPRLSGFLRDLLKRS